MIRVDFIPRQRTEPRRAHGGKALMLSIVIHALLLGLLVTLTLYFGKKLEEIKTASPDHPTAILLPTLVITDAPGTSEAVTPHEQAVVPKAIPIPIANRDAVPVLDHSVTPHQETAVVKTETPLALPSHQPSIAKNAPVTHTTPKKVELVHAPVASSFTEGANTMPHPPYPPDASNRGEEGTVVMTVTFDTRGDVVQADVVGSSGVAVLDHSTQSYVRQNWHSSTYANQTVSVPIRYNLKHF